MSIVEDSFYETNILKAYAAETIRNIADIVNLYWKGHASIYRLAAVQLRLLLCDTQDRGKKDISLALRVNPNLKLHQMKNRLNTEKIEQHRKEQESLVGEPLGPATYLPFTQFGTPGPIRFKIFSLDKPLIPVSEWLEQIIAINRGYIISIRELIRSVCDKDGGAHLDAKPNETLREARRWYMNSPNKDKIGLHIPLIISIGEYIVSELPSLLSLNEGKD